MFQPRHPDQVVRIVEHRPAEFFHLPLFDIRRVLLDDVVLLVAKDVLDRLNLEFLQSLGRIQIRLPLRGEPILPLIEFGRREAVQKLQKKQRRFALRNGDAQRRLFREVVQEIPYRPAGARRRPPATGGLLLLRNAREPAGVWRFAGARVFVRIPIFEEAAAPQRLGERKQVLVGRSALFQRRRVGKSQQERTDARQREIAPIERSGDARQSLRLARSVDGQAIACRQIPVDLVDGAHAPSSA